MHTLDLPLDRLHPHPANANIMPEAMLAKLAAHLQRTGRYPPLIVRPWEDDYQLLDGHHRALALRRIGRALARCVVWEVDDAEALLLLATLNRLEGADDPLRRADLLSRLRERRGVDMPELAAMLPENAERLERLLSLRDPVRVRPPKPLETMPVAVHFFLLPRQRRELEAVLAAAGGTREEALMAMVQRVGAGVGAG